MAYQRQQWLLEAHMETNGAIGQTYIGAELVSRLAPAAKPCSPLLCSVIALLQSWIQAASDWFHLLHRVEIIE